MLHSSELGGMSSQPRNEHPSVVDVDTSPVVVVVDVPAPVVDAPVVDVPASVVADVDPLDPLVVALVVTVTPPSTQPGRSPTASAPTQCVHRLSSTRTSLAQPGIPQAPTFSNPGGASPSSRTPNHGRHSCPSPGQVLAIDVSQKGVQQPGPSQPGTYPASAQ